MGESWIKDESRDVLDETMFHQYFGDHVMSKHVNISYEGLKNRVNSFIKATGFDDIKGLDEPVVFSRFYGNSREERNSLARRCIYKCLTENAEEIETWYKSRTVVPKELVLNFPERIGEGYAVGTDPEQRFGLSRIRVVIDRSVVRGRHFTIVTAFPEANPIESDRIWNAMDARKEEKEKEAEMAAKNIAHKKNSNGMKRGMPDVAHNVSTGRKKQNSPKKKDPTRQEAPRTEAKKNTLGITEKAREQKLRELKAAEKSGKQNARPGNTEKEKYTILKGRCAKISLPDGHSVRVYRIQATKDFGDVKAGDLGGWVENANNLSQEGSCWVADNAMAIGNARVMDDAVMKDSAQAVDDAQIGGSAVVEKNAMVADMAHVCGNALVTENAQVSGKALISDRASASGFVLLSGTSKVIENAIVADWAEISDCATVKGDASISGDALVTGNACISDMAAVKEHAHVSGNAQVMDGSVVGGNAFVRDDAVIMGESKIYDNAKVVKEACLIDAEVFGDVTIDWDAEDISLCHDGNEEER